MRNCDFAFAILRLRYTVFLMLAVCICSSAAKPTDFEEAMGKGTSAWKFVQTSEDWENLHFYKKLYRQHCNVKPSEAGDIPKIIHFVWLGPERFPKESVKNVDCWIQKHPGWKFTFWADADIPCPHPAMEKRKIDDLPFAEGKNSYNRAQNYGEKSQVLRYAILLNEGGIYADHDTVPTASLEPLLQKCDFFCGLAPLKPSMLSSSVYPVNHLIGSKAGHPIFAAALQWLDRNWKRLEIEYGGGTGEAELVNCMSHRTLQALEIGIKLLAGRSASRDVILPSQFLSSPEKGIFASHLERRLWARRPSRSEIKIKEQLYSIQEQQKNGFVVLMALGGALAALIGISYWSLKTNKHS